MKIIAPEILANLQKLCLKTEVDLADVSIFEPLMHDFGIEEFLEIFEKSVVDNENKDRQKLMFRRNLFVIEMLKDELNHECQICGENLKKSTASFARLGVVDLAEKLPNVVLLCEAHFTNFSDEKLKIISEKTYKQSGEVCDLHTPLFE